MHHHHLPNRKKLINSSSAKHRKDPAEVNWPDIIRQWESSGTPQKEFCHQHALSYNSFVFQRMQLKKAQQATSGITPRLLSVTKEKEADTINPPFTPVGFVVQWPNGIRLCVPPQADAATLGALLSHLGG
jgi:hypothetical protein